MCDAFITAAVSSKKEVEITFNNREDKELSIPVIWCPSSPLSLCCTQRSSVLRSSLWTTLSPRIQTDRGRGGAGSRASSSPRRRCTSWSAASSSRGTCPPRRGTTWPACSNSPRPRWRSGSRTGGTSASGRGRTRAWRWCPCRRPGGCRCRCWCGTGSLAWRRTRPLTTRPPTAWATSTTSLITTTRRSVTTPAPAATRTMRAVTPQPRCKLCRDPPAEGTTWTSVWGTWVTCRTRSPPVTGRYMASGHGKPTGRALRSPVHYTGLRSDCMAFFFFFKKTCRDFEEFL